MPEAPSPLIYIAPIDPGPPPSGWIWYERATGGTFYQFHTNDVLIPWPPVLITADNLSVARARAQEKQDV
ncbi:hypothetical protein KKH23_11145 [Patescibacteria group bacterium]|nr:hypothetical protein [Patescibacteria group bacterium]